VESVVFCSKVLAKGTPMPQFVIVVSSPCLYVDPNTGTALEAGNDEPIGYVCHSSEDTWEVTDDIQVATKFEDPMQLLVIECYFQSEGEDLRLTIKVID
jgi:hypothetical protein